MLPEGVVRPVQPVITINEQIHLSAVKWGVNERILRQTLQCESKLKLDAIGEMGEVGIAQIYLPAHKDVSKEEALNPTFAIDWTAHQFSIGNAKAWTCWRQDETRRLSNRVS